MVDRSKINGTIESIFVCSSWIYLPGVNHFYRGTALSSEVSVYSLTFALFVFYPLISLLLLLVNRQENRPPWLLNS